MMYIAFPKRFTPSFFGWLVRIFAGQPTHCVLVNEHNIGYEAQSGIGVRAIQIDPTQYDRIPVDVDAQRVFAFCEERLGLQYDYVGALLYFTNFTTRNRWTCSEFVSEACAYAGAPMSILDAGRRPRRLQAWALHQQDLKHNDVTFTVLHEYAL